MGETVLAFVNVLDSRDEAFMSNQHRLMSLLADPKTDNIEIRFQLSCPLLLCSVAAAFVSLFPSLRLSPSLPLPLLSTMFNPRFCMNFNVRNTAKG